jgi:hypothetical protein
MTTFRRFICRECGRLMGVIYMSREEPPSNLCGKCDVTSKEKIQQQPSDARQVAGKQSGEAAGVPSEVERCEP